MPSPFSMPGHRGAGLDGLRSFPPGTGVPSGGGTGGEVVGRARRPGRAGRASPAPRHLRRDDGRRTTLCRGLKGAARSRFTSGELDARRGRYANAAMEGRVVLFPPRVAQSPRPPTDLPWGAGGFRLAGLAVLSRFVLLVVVDGGAVEAQGGAHLVHPHAGRGVRVSLLVLVGPGDQLTHDDHPVSLTQVVEDALGLVTPDHAPVKRGGTIHPR